MTSHPNFTLLLPRKIVFGWGRRSELGGLVSDLGQRVLLIDGSRTLRTSVMFGEISSSLAERQLQVEHVASVQGEPTIEDVDDIASKVRELNPREGDVVLGLGGGAAIDTAKAVAALATQPESVSVREYLEGIGTGKKLTARPLPIVAVPTTAGTGSEATKNAVISCNDPPCKKSFRSEEMVPSLAVIDPEFMASCPPEQTAHSGMDAITQLIESFLSRRANAATSSVCLTALSGTVTALTQAVQDGANREARETMAAAALASGIALANSGLGMAHGVAAALGAHHNVPHGLACAVMLPVALRTNRSHSPERWRPLSDVLCPNGEECETDHADRVIDVIAQLSAELNIPTKLRDLGVAKESLPDLVTGSRGNSMNGNPRELSDEELAEILEGCW